MLRIVILFFVALANVSCETIEPRIVGGIEAKDGEFPYQVSIRNRAVHECGGAIIDEYWILTAAHCLVGRLERKLTVVTGTNDLNNGGAFYNVSKMIPHAGFSKFTHKNDIGLIKLDRPITFGPKVQPIRLPVQDIKDGKILTLAGWGQLGIDVESPNKLQKIELKSISNLRCVLAHRPFVWLSNLCTYNKIGEGACFGDSGGPLVYDNQVMGIVSWTKPCAIGLPDVFTRVYHYLLWITVNKME